MLSDSIRFTITLPDAVARSLDEDVEATDMPRSTLIAHYIAEHYERASLPDFEERIFKLKSQHEDEMTYTKRAYEEQLEGLQQKCAAAEHQAETEADALTRQLHQEADDAAQSAALQEARIKELQDELKLVKKSLKSLEQDVVNKDDQLQLLGQEKQTIMEQAEEEIAAKNENIQQLERGMQELLTKAGHERTSLDDVITDLRHTIDQERASKETVRTGLQHELELTQTKLKVVERQVVDLKGQLLKETEEKQNLYKQLELVTLRLPAPKESLFSSIVGRSKKDKEQESGHG